MFRSLSIFLLSVCSSCGETGLKNIAEEKKSTSLSLENVQGYWVCKEEQRDYSKVNDGLIRDAINSDILLPVNISWQITNDSLWCFEYPCELKYSFRFQLKNDSIFPLDKINAFSSVGFEEESLMIVIPGNGHAPAKHYRFLRDSADIAALQRLKSDTINLECLTGHFSLQTKRYPNDEASFNEEPPVKIQSEFQIENAIQAKKLTSDRTMLLLVNGKQESFMIKNISWNNFGSENESPPSEEMDKHVIILTPGDWWREEKFEVRYQEK